MSKNIRGKVTVLVTSAAAAGNAAAPPRAGSSHQLLPTPPTPTESTTTSLSHVRDTPRRRRRGATVLAAGTVLVLGMVGGLRPGPALASGFSLPTACPVLEALIGDGVSGPDPTARGEVVRVSGSGQGTLTENLSPTGGPDLDSPMDIAFDHSDVLTADMGVATGVSQVVKVDHSSGARTLISGPGRGSGPALNGPYSIAELPNGNMLVLDYEPTTYMPRLLQITPTGSRSVLSSGAVGSGSTFGNPERVRVLNGAIYLISTSTQLVSVNAITGNRTLISGATRGTGPAFSFPVSMTTDGTASSIIVLDQTYGGAGALIRVDLATGNRTVLSSNTSPSGGALFNNPYDVVRNSCDNAFYVLHTAGNGVAGNVMRVDAARGTRTLLASYTAANSSPSNYTLLMRPLIAQVTP